MKGKALKDISIQDIKVGLKVISPTGFYNFSNHLATDLYGEIVFIRDLKEDSYIIIEFDKKPSVVMHRSCGQWFVDMDREDL